ncbi:hypothetical protein [Micromonospora sp. NRRL B-16802]|uniref:hypothetical protein n=1 Tax=Micromonospora sp. NRRL B-16802 TaxID=1415541 RepID=UPI000AB3174D|nr:hypothetical protein [Micromonospora sp. NRRL B-16802]
MRLADFSDLSLACRETGSGLSAFKLHAIVSGLRWPDDVLEQWLYDHGDNNDFLQDYGTVDLSRLQWEVEAVSVEELARMPTGHSTGGYIDEIAENPDHWINNRSSGVHKGVALCWQTHGTWKRWPILLHRSVLNSSATGLQIVEGRTRVGILKGRYRKGDLVAKNHLTWVGCLRT